MTEVNTCHSCAFENPAGMRYCGQCSQPLAAVCPGCSFENPGNFRFCGQCGAPLCGVTPAAPGDTSPERGAGEAEPPVERRNVTVLFADLTGFTSLSERMDPEDVYRTVNRYIEILVERVTKYEGTVDKFTGDGLIAIFGAPVAHENDPERAVRAALEAQSSLAELAGELESELGISLQARIGINSGTVVTGSVGSELARDRYTALGDTVNVAARLQASAEPGSVLVSEATHRLVGPLFEFRDVGALTVKGRQEPVVAYEVLGIRSGTHSVRGARGLRTPLVGRGTELARVTRAVDRLAREGDGHVVLVSGEAGVGKTRLIREAIAARTGVPLRFLQATAASHERALSYALIGSLVRSGLGIREAAEIAAQQTRLRARFEELGLGDTDHLSYLESILGLPISDPLARQRLQSLHPAQLRQQIFVAVREWLQAEAARSSIVAVLDDLHWADRLSVDLLLFLLPICEEVPISFVCVSRPTEGEAVSRLEDFAGQALPGRFERLDLFQLSPAESRELVREMLKRPELPRTLEELVVERAEGNPFFVEELVGVLIDHGVLYQEADQWRVRQDTDFRVVEVPASLDGLIMARVDALEPPARMALQTAAVQGREFDSRVVKYILDREAEIDARALLAELEDRGFLTANPEDPRSDLGFRHGLTRDTVYERLLRARRRELHLLAAQAIATLYPDAAHERPEVLAEHYYRSSQPLEALSYALQAGDRARDRFSNQDAEQFYVWVLELLERGGSLPPRRMLELLLSIGDVRNYLGKYELALQDYGAALERLERDGEFQSPHEVAEVMRRIGRTHERRGDYKQALHWLDRALASLADAGEAQSVLTRARIYNDYGWVAHRQGQQDEAHEWFSEALELLEGSSHHAELASIYHRLGVSAYYRRNWDEAESLARRGLKAREGMGDTIGMANSHSLLGMIHGMRGDWQAAIESFERSRALCRKSGNLNGLALQQNNLAFILLGMGEFERAAQELEQCLSLAEKMGNRTWEGLARTNLAHLELLRGNLGDALEQVSLALRVAEEIGSQEQQAEAHWVQALALAQLGELEDARRSAHLSLRHAREISDPQNEACALRALGVIAREQQDWDEARARLEESLMAFGQLNIRFEAAKSELELGILQRRVAAEGRRRARAPMEARRFTEKALQTFRDLGAAHHIPLAERELELLRELERTRA